MTIRVSLITIRRHIEPILSYDTQYEVPPTAKENLICARMAEIFSPELTVRQLSHRNTVHSKRMQTLNRGINLYCHLAMALTEF
jgi:hypothetical protein